MGAASTAERSGRALLALAWLLALGCGPEQPPSELDRPGSGPGLQRPPSDRPGVRPEKTAQQPPIPPLEGAERPSRSPLEELSDEIIDPAPELPEFTLPSLPAEPRPAPGDSAPESVAALDLELLSKRLRDTDALGVFTKVALKNQIDDLTDELRRFHRKDRGSIASLRERYDALVLKIMSLVQDAEPALARDIARSRERLWAMLSNPQDFLELVGGTS